MKKTNQKVSAKKKHRGENSLLFGSIILCLITLGSITLSMVVMFRYKALELDNSEILEQLDAYRTSDVNMYSEQELQAIVSENVDKATSETYENTLADFKNTLMEYESDDGDGTWALLRDTFPENIVVPSDSGYQFFPDLESIVHNDYIQENVIIDESTGRYTYEENGETVSHMGIDVSKYNGKINWKKVKNDGVEYAFIRSGIRGYTEGDIMEDSAFIDNIKGATENGINVGVYFFTQAITEEEAVEEAEYVIDQIEGYDVTYPIAIDVEEMNKDGVRSDALTKEERTRLVIAFCDRIKEAGYRPIIYGNLRTFMIMLDVEQLENYDKWFASYLGKLYYPYNFTIWQYSSKGRVAGIDGDVDYNIGWIDYAE